MLFSSPLFVFLFLPLVLLAYYGLDPRFRNPVLLLSSLIFYAWGEVIVVWLMLLSCVINWALGLWVDRARSRGQGRGVVALALCFNLGLLVLFKYAHWIWTSVSGLLLGLGWIDAPCPVLSAVFEASSLWSETLTEDDGTLRLPIGISFFTFQACSYVIDIYRRDGDVQRGPLNFALYISLFPQLIAGPIVRYKDVALQLTSRISSWSGFAYGARRFVLGLGKKMLIANAAAEVADRIFALEGGLSTPVAWLGIFAFTIQIYFDFSGYSDMAIGLGHMFGFRFLENFDHPYVARSITEFWRRWHISLSNWFRDYLYIPLGGNRSGLGRTYFNLVLVFFLCGLWHGASANFVVWGLFHGLFLVLERRGLRGWLERRSAWVQHGYLLTLVMVGWVFFRADDLQHALGYIGAMLGAGANSELYPIALFVDPRIVTALAAGVIGSVPWLAATARWHSRQVAAGHGFRSLATEALGLALVALVFLAASLELAGSSYNPFIYFRF